MLTAVLWLAGVVTTHWALWCVVAGSAGLHPAERGRLGVRSGQLPQSTATAQGWPQSTAVHRFTGWLLTVRRLTHGHWHGQPWHQRWPLSATVHRLTHGHHDMETACWHTQWSLTWIALTPQRCSLTDPVVTDVENLDTTGLTVDRLSGHWHG